MNFLKNFFTAVSKSVWDVQWLREQRKAGGRAWSYFFIFMLVIVLLQTVTLLWALPKGANEFWTEAKSEIPEFQADYTPEGGLLVEGVEQPYIFEEEDDGQSMYLYIDTLTTTTLAAEDIFPENIDIGILVTAQKATIYQESESKYETVVFRDISDESWDFTNEDVVEWGDKILAWIVWILAPIITLFMFIFWSIGKLVFLAWASLLAWLIARFGGKKWEYKDVYTVGLYAITLPTLVNLLLMAVGQRIKYIYVLLLVGLLVWVMYAGNEKGEKSEKEEKPEKKN